MQKIRVFVSSPSDVSAERQQVNHVIKRIQADYQDLEFEVILWEEKFYSASSTFQKQISSPSDADIVLCILWKRLGSPLPDEYKRPDGSYRTGTEYEFETAMEAALVENIPDILVYRKTAEITFNAATVEQEQAELQALESFWRRWIQNEQGHFTAGFKPFADNTDFARLLEKDLRSWLKHKFHHVSWPPSKGSPYRGLDVFTEEHAPIYFGRRRQVNQIRARLLANEKRDGIGFLLVIGASGSGKSSLMGAGLIPAIKDTHPIEGIREWRTLICRPSSLGSAPLAGLVKQLCQADVLPELLEGDYNQQADISELWQSSPSLAARPLLAALKRISDNHQTAEQSRLLIVLDQFEEFLKFEQQKLIDFIKVIDNLARSGQVWVVATMRSDFYPELFAIPEIMLLKDASRQYDLTAPEARDLEEIITGPAKAAGLQFETDEQGESLDQTLLQDAGNNTEVLPLLEFTLERLYEERDNSTQTLTFNAYRHIGGLYGALTQAAEDALAGIKDQLQDDLPRVFARVMRELISIDLQAKATRRVAAMARFKHNRDDKLLVDALLDHRLLTAYTASIDPQGEALAVINITHESLIHNWPRLQHWLEQDQELLQVRERIDNDCQLWLMDNKRPDLLAAAGKRLQDVCYLNDSGISLNDSTREYIEASIRRSQKLQRRKRIAFFSFSIISLLAAIFGAITLNSLDELKQQENEIEKQHLKLSRFQLETSKQTAQSLYAYARSLHAQGRAEAALKAYIDAMKSAYSVNMANGSTTSPSAKKDTEILYRSLGTSLWTIAGSPARTPLANGNMMFPVLSPDRNTLLLISKTSQGYNRVQLLNSRNFQPIGKAFNSRAAATPISGSGFAFSDDSQKLAISQITEKGEELRIIDTRSGNTTHTHLSGLEYDSILKISFTDDSHLMLSNENRLLSWNINENRIYSELPVAIEHREIINDFILANSRTILIENILQKTLSVWEKTEAGSWQKQQDNLLQGRFSTAPFYSPVRINDRQIILPIIKHESIVPTVVFDFLDISYLDLIETIETHIYPYIALLDSESMTLEYIPLKIPEDEHTDSGRNILHGHITSIEKNTQQNSISLIVEYRSPKSPNNTNYISLQYAYKLETDKKPKLDKPVYINSFDSYEDDKFIINGFFSDNKLLYVNTINGLNYMLDTEAENATEPLPARISEKSRGIIELNDNRLLFATDTGAYVVDRNITEKNIKTARIGTNDNLPQLRNIKSSYRLCITSDCRNQVTDNSDNIIFTDNNGKLIVSDEYGNHLLNISSIKSIDIQHNFKTSTMENPLTAVAYTHGNTEEPGYTLFLDNTNRLTSLDSHGNTHSYTLPGKAIRHSIISNGQALAIAKFNNKISIIKPETQDSLQLSTRARVSQLEMGKNLVAYSDENDRIGIQSLNKQTQRAEKKSAQINLLDDAGIRKRIKNRKTAHLSALKLNTDENLLAAASWKGEIAIYAVSNTFGQQQLLIHGNQAAIEKLAWNPQNSQLASADRKGVINLWNRDNRYQGQLAHHKQLAISGVPVALVYSADGQWLIAATDNGRVYLWNADSGILMKELRPDDITAIRDLRLLEDNWHLVISDKDGSLTVLEVGDYLIPENVLDYFKLSTENNLWTLDSNAIPDKNHLTACGYFSQSSKNGQIYWKRFLNQVANCLGITEQTP